jgi:uncharacterized membrane protein YkvA (DUF1232 family)
MGKSNLSVYTTMKKKQTVREYIRNFDEQKLFRKLKNIAGKISINLLYYILVLFYLTTDKSVPFKTRLIFIAALGYLILPTDIISDFIPVLGFTDDAAFIAYAISNATIYITPEIKGEAIKRLTDLIGEEKANEIILKDLFQYPDKGNK